MLGVTQDQDKASKIEEALNETQRDVKMETTFMSYVATRKLNYQQLKIALGTPLPAVLEGYATLWTGGSYDYDDLVRLDGPEM